jgi:hypothetical protein
MVTLYFPIMCIDKSFLSSALSVSQVGHLMSGNVSILGTQMDRNGSYCMHHVFEHQRILMFCPHIVLLSS